MILTKYGKYGLCRPGLAQVRLDLAMGYGIPESYGILLVTELVDTKNPWVITGYGLSQVWFRTESTVVI